MTGYDRLWPKQPVWQMCGRRGASFANATGWDGYG